MKKKILMVFVLTVSIISEIFAQQLEKITYEELLPDGNIGRTITVEAYHIGWQQQETRLENGMQVYYQTTCFLDNEWSDWKLNGRQPAFVSTIRQLFDMFSKEYTAHPKAAIKYYLNDMEIILMLSIPNGKVAPFWWSQSGNSYYTFYKMYVMKQ